METNKTYHGDCLDLLKNIPNETIDLCIIDPPYFRVKNHYWDNQWDNQQQFLLWMESVLIEIYRTLKKSGSFYCFCYPKLSFDVETVIRKKFNVLNHIVWEKTNDKGFDGWMQKCSKESLRKYYPNSERIIFAEKQSFGKLFREQRLKSGLSTIKLAELIGAHGKTNHGGSVSNWENDLNIPTELQYKKLLKYLKLPNRNEIIRTFNSKVGVQYTDVLHFKTVRPYKGKHPCEKPLDLIQHLVCMSSNKGDVVLDCFAGSGILKDACINTNRKYILIEKDADYFKKIKSK